MKISAGLMMYKTDPDLKIFLVHPGGPFFKFNDHCWGIPKGLQENNEDLLETAKREFEEETGIRIPVATGMTDLGKINYNNKDIYCWAFEGNLPKDFVFKSNLTNFGWPENDKGEFFDLETAKQKILPAQKVFLDRLFPKFLPA